MTDLDREGLIKVFSERFNIALERRGVARKDVAEAIETEYRQVWGYANGKNLPNAYTLYKIAATLEVSVDWLLGITDKEPTWLYFRGERNYT